MASARRGDGIRRGGDEGPVEVVLVEGTDVDPEDLGPPGGAQGEGAADRASDGSGRGRARRHVVVGVGLVAVLALAGAGSAALDRHRADQRRAALAEVRGIAVSLEQPVSERWSVPGWLAATTGDLVIVARNDSSALVAVEPATGAVRWTRPSPGAEQRHEHCETLTRQEQPDDVAADDGPGLLLCSLDGGIPVGEDTESSVAVVRADDGTTVHQRRFTGSVVQQDVVDDDRLVVTIGHEGVVEVVRWDPDTGRDVWSWTSPDPVEHDPALGLPAVEVRDHAVVVADVALDVGTGDPVPVPPVAVAEADGDVDAVLTELPSGHRVVVRWSDDGKGEVVVETPDGARLSVLDGWPSSPWLVDDGSRPDLLMVDGEGSLSALDLTTGEPTWSVDAHPGHTLLLVDGLLVRNEHVDAHGALGADVVVRDADDGTERWRARSVTSSVQTDGALVLLTEQAAGGAAAPGADPLRVLDDRLTGPVTLIARGLHDGTEAWRVPFRYTEWMEVAPDGTLLVQDGTGVSGWR